MSDGEKTDLGLENGEVAAPGTDPKPATPDFAVVKANGHGDAAMLAAMARPLEQRPQEKMSLKSKIVHEGVEVGGVILYLFMSFAILETFRCGTLLAECSQNDFISGYTTAVVAALGLGKFVFVLDKMRFTQRFKDRPLIVPILYKTVLFTILANVILHAEDRILHRVVQQPHYNDPLELVLCAFTHQLAFFVMFFIFFCFRGVAHVIGEKRMFRLFFVSRDDFLTK